MSSAQQLLDTAGRRRSPATSSEFHAGRAPGNKGQRSAADPPTVEEIIAVMRLIQRRLGHSHLSTTGTYLQGISSEEIISTVNARRWDGAGSCSEPGCTGRSSRNVIDSSDYYLLVMGGKVRPGRGGDKAQLPGDGVGDAADSGPPVMAFLHADLDKLTVEKSDTDPHARAALLAYAGEVVVLDEPIVGGSGR